MNAQRAEFRGDFCPLPTPACTAAPINQEIKKHPNEQLHMTQALPDPSTVSDSVIPGKPGKNKETVPVGRAQKQKPTWAASPCSWWEGAESTSLGIQGNPPRINITEQAGIPDPDECEASQEALIWLCKQNTPRFDRTQLAGSHSMLTHGNTGT